MSERCNDNKATNVIRIVHVTIAVPPISTTGPNIVYVTCTISFFTALAATATLTHTLFTESPNESSINACM